MSSSERPAQFSILRYILFFLALVALIWVNLFGTYQGLNQQQAMDQAQIAREISRGNGFSTKMIRPVAHFQAMKAAGGNVAMTNFKDTYHSPLQPLLLSAVFKLVDADSPQWEMLKDDFVFPLDRVVSTFSIVFFLLALVAIFLSVRALFDQKMAFVTVALILFSATFWQYAVSGLPQMLMLFCFSSAIYCVIRAEKAAEAFHSIYGWIILAAVFLTLMSLAHWMTVWITIGFIIYAAFAYRPRAVVGMVVLFVLSLAVIYPMIRANGIAGNPFGVAYLTLYNGSANGSEDVVMRMTDLDTKPLSLDGFIVKIAFSTLNLMRDVIPLLGGIFIAPIFFITLLSPYRSAVVNRLRWCIVLMWMFGALGLAFFGVKTNEVDANQTLLLFAPIMTAYALTFLATMWLKIEGISQISFLRNAYLWVVFIICSLPLFLNLPKQLQKGLQFSNRGGLPSWPPYFPQVLAGSEFSLKKLTKPNEVVFSDQPWASAWYADRVSIWLPQEAKGFDRLETFANEFSNPVAGILITPSSYGSSSITDLAYRYGDFISYTLDGNIARLIDNDNFSLPALVKTSKYAASRYPYRIPLLGADICFYTDRVMNMK